MRSVRVIFSKYQRLEWGGVVVVIVFCINNSDGNACAEVDIFYLKDNLLNRSIRVFSDMVQSNQLGKLLVLK